MSKKQKMTAVVISQEKIAEDIYSMWLKAEPVAAEAVPGQFISMYTNDGAKLLPRPISLCEIDKEKGALRVVYRVTGEKTGTKQFSQMKAGDSLRGHGTAWKRILIWKREKKKKRCFIGGGIGVPPMLELAKQLTAGYQTECQLVMGYRSETFLTKEIGSKWNTLYCDRRWKYRNKRKRYGCNCSGQSGSRCDLCLRTDSDAACDQAVCSRRKAYLVLHFHGRENGVRNRSLSWHVSASRRKWMHHSHVHNKRVCKDGPVFLATEVEL